MDGDDRRDRLRPVGPVRSSGVAGHARFRLSRNNASAARKFAWALGEMEQFQHHSGSCSQGEHEHRIGAEAEDREG